MAKVTIAVILDPKKIKSATVSIVPPSVFFEEMGLDAMILLFLKLRVLGFFLSFKIFLILYCGIATQLELDMEQVPNRIRSTSRLYIVTLFI